MAKGLTRVYFVSCAFFRGKGKTVAANAFSLFLLHLVNDSEQCCIEKAHELFVRVILSNYEFTWASTRDFISDARQSITVLGRVCLRGLNKSTAVNDRSSPLEKKEAE